MNPRVLGTYEQLIEIVEREGINKIVVTVTDRWDELPIQALLSCKLQSLDIEEGTVFYEKISSKIMLENIEPSAMILSKDFLISPLLQLYKRVMDFLLSILGLVLATPLMVLIAILIKIDSRGPVFYSQERVGQHGKRFALIKFRSMHVDAEVSTGPVFTQLHDARVTRIGKPLRTLHLDELPQLFNVLRGEMTFVGPRPERPFFVEQFEKEIPYYTQRQYGKPGLTGWAQVNYPYGSTREDAEEKLRFDLYYVKNMSLLLDFYIMLKTVKIAVLGQGAR